MPLPAILFLAPLALIFPFSLAISPEARRIQTTFTFLLSSSPLSNETSIQCPGTINHRSIRRYKGINPSNASQILEGVLWRHLSINGIACLSSDQPEAATRFLPSIPSPPETSADTANPWFLTGLDNSERRCGPFRASLPANYFFTDNMPKFKQRFIDSGIIPINVDTLPDKIENPKRGDVFMLSQQSDPSSNGTVSANLVCMYLASTPQPSPSSSPPARDGDDSGSACFPGDARVTRENRGRVFMRDLRIGDRVLVGREGGKGYVYSEVVSFSHKDNGIRTRFVRVWISIMGFCEKEELLGRNETMTELTATSGHLIRMGDGELRAIGMIGVGEAVRLGVCGQMGRVERVIEVWGVGLFSPLTRHGDLVVEDVVASCYTTSLRASAAHALLVPVRLGFHMLSRMRADGVEWCGVIDVLRWVLR